MFLVVGYVPEYPPKIDNFKDQGQISRINRWFDDVWFALDGRSEIFKLDVNFESGAGLTYGEISAKDNATPVTLNSAAKIQITAFDTNGASNNTTPDHTNDYITCTKAGKYLVTISIHIKNNAAQNHVVDVSLYKNTGTIEFENIHSHRNLTGGSGDIGSISMSGIVTVVANDTIEVWATTDSGSDRSVTFSDITLSIVNIGG